MERHNHASQAALARFTLSRFNAAKPACLALPALVNSAYGRTGNAAEAKPGFTAGFVAPVATKPAHSPDALARATQSGSTGDANKPGAGRVTRGSRRYRARRG